MARPSEDDDLSMFFDTPYSTFWSMDPSKPAQSSSPQPDAETSRLHETAFLGSFCIDPLLVESNDLFDWSNSSTSSRSAQDLASGSLSSSSSSSSSSSTIAPSPVPPAVRSQSAPPPLLASDNGHAPVYPYSASALIEPKTEFAPGRARPTAGDRKRQLAGSAVHGGKIARHQGDDYATALNGDVINGARRQNSGSSSSSGGGGTLANSRSQGYLAVVPKLVLREQFTDALLANNPYEFEMLLERPIPKEIRTGTPTESRCFRVAIALIGNWKRYHLSTCTARICYHRSKKAKSFDAGEQAPESPNRDILAGDTQVGVSADGLIKFHNLSLKEGSTRHRERLFCLELTVHSSVYPDFRFVRRTSAFYAFTHRKVLSRRSNITLRMLSQSFGCMEGGEELLLVGCPFIKGPQFTIQFQTPHGSVFVMSAHIEFISQSLISFATPPYPAYMTSFRGAWPDGHEAQCSLLVSNDGKNFSAPIPFYYVVGPQLPPSLVKQRADMIETAAVAYQVKGPPDLDA